MKTKFLFITIILSVIITGCKKKELPDPKNTNTVITAPFYFKGTIDGKEVVFEDGKNSYGNGTLGTGSYTSTGKNEEQWTTIRNYMVSENSIAVGVKKFFNGGAPDCTQQLAMVSVGVASYSFNNSDGAIIMYTDENGDTWYSELGSQTGNNFEVVEYIDNSSSISNKIIKVKFSAKLYNDDGDFKTLTNGEIRGRIFNCM